jgi:hypothetical protein
MSTTITVGANRYDAARCPECGCKVHPESSLELHHDMHRIRELRLAAMLKELRNKATFRSSQRANRTLRPIWIVRTPRKP